MIKANLIGDEKENRFHKMAQKIKKDMIAFMNQESIKTKELLDMTVEHWGDPPTIARTIDSQGRDLRAWVGPQGTGFQVSKWRILNRGAPRYAKMKRPPEFIRKTHPRTLRTNPGTIPSKKGVLYYTWPFPIATIEAREWTLIARLLIQRRMRKARDIIKRGVRV